MMLLYEFWLMIGFDSESFGDVGYIDVICVL